MKPVFNGHFLLKEALIMIKAMNADLDKADNLKARMLFGKILELDKQIQLLLNRKKYINQQLAKLIAHQLEKQDEFENGECVYNLDYNYFYIWLGNKLHYINEEINKNENT